MTAPPTSNRTADDAVAPAHEVVLELRHVRGSLRQVREVRAGADRALVETLPHHGGGVRVHLRFGRIVVSEIEVPHLLVNLA
jgi:hypothetical protein